MCCRDCACKRADDEQPKPPTDGDEMLSGDEFIERWYTPELSGPAA